MNPRDLEKILAADQRAEVSAEMQLADLDRRNSKILRKAIRKLERRSLQRNAFAGEVRQ